VLEDNGALRVLHVLVHPSVALHSLTDMRCRLPVAS
jgi:hypothetical protein